MIFIALTPESALALGGVLHWGVNTSSCHPRQEVHHLFYPLRDHHHHLIQPLSGAALMHLWYEYMDQCSLTTAIDCSNTQRNIIYFRLEAAYSSLSGEVP